MSIFDAFTTAIKDGEQLHPNDKELSPRKIANDLFEEVFEAEVAEEAYDKLSLFRELLDIAVVAFRIAAGEFKHEPNSLNFEPNRESCMSIIKSWVKMEGDLFKVNTVFDVLTVANNLAVALYTLEINFPYINSTACRCAGYALALADKVQSGVFDDTRVESESESSSATKAI